MKKIYALAFTLFTALTGMAQTTLVNYNFNSTSSYPVSPDASASGVTGSFTSSESFQTYTGAATGTSAFTQNTTAGNAIAMANSSGTNTKYFLLELSGSSISEYQGLQIYLQSERSSTGATTINIATSTDGSSYTTQGTNITVPTSFGESIISLTGLTGASTVYIRLEASGASSTGTLRIDNLEVQGTFENAWQSSGSNVYFTGGNVGVGTSSPAYPLDVNGATHINGALTSGATTVSSLTNSGNLSVTGTSIFTGAIKNSSLAGTGSRLLETDASGNISPLSAGTSTQVLFGNNTWGSLPAQVIQTSGSNAYFTGGNFGIGTSSPAYPLDVTGNARITGVLTAGGINSSSSNLDVTTPAVFTGNVTLSSLTGTGNRQLLVNGNNVITSTQSLPWEPGGNANGSLQTLGTTDGYDLPFIAGGTSGSPASIERMRITSAGLVGIATAFPSALLHVNTSPAGNTLPGLIVDDQNPSEGTPEFIVNSNGSTMINAIAAINGDAFNVNFQESQAQGGGFVNQTLLNAFKITFDGTNGKVIIPSGRLGIGTPTPIALLHVNTSNSGALAGLIVDDQNPSEGTPEFLVNSNGSTVINAIAGVNADALNISFQESQAQGGGFVNQILSPAFRVSFDGTNGNVFIPALKSGTSSTYNSILVDANGKLVKGSSVSSTSSSAWLLGGNSVGASGTLGTTDGDLVLTAGPDPHQVGAGLERMRITASGNIAVANDNQILLSGNDPHHGLGAFGANNSPSTFAGKSGINGPVLYGYSGGALGYTGGTGANSNGIALLWDANGAVHIGGSQSKFSNTNHANAALTIYGESVSTAHYVTQQNWSDFVFDKKYALMPLNEVENFYKKNHHLPNVPSEKEIQEKGNNLGETDAVLLQKIEELTLYLVQQQKEIEALKAELKSKK